MGKVFGSKAAVQRCQWHKRENVVRYLATNQRATFRRKLQRAYNQSAYGQAKAALKKVRAELNLLKQSAVASLDEDFEETLTVHRLGLRLDDDKDGASIRPETRQPSPEDPVAFPEPRPFRALLQIRSLLPQGEVLGGQLGAISHDISNHEKKNAEHAHFTALPNC